jgi:hypothetical protein
LGGNDALLADRLSQNHQGDGADLASAPRFRLGLSDGARAEPSPKCRERSTLLTRVDRRSFPEFRHFLKVVRQLGQRRLYVKINGRACKLQTFSGVLAIFLCRWHDDRSFAQDSPSRHV